MLLYDRDDHCLQVDSAVDVDFDASSPGPFSYSVLFIHSARRPREGLCVYILQINESGAPTLILISSEDDEAGLGPRSTSMQIMVSI